jgi:hypothetical protein
MAIYRITPATSVSLDGDHKVAFGAGTPNPDTLIVEQGAYLETTGTWDTCAALLSGGFWKATIFGSVLSNFTGIYVYTDAGSSSIVVADDGVVRGDSAISAGNETPESVLNSITVKNAGEITGVQVGIVLHNTHGNISNSGTITGSSWSVVDSTGNSNDSIVNSGTMNGHIELGGGSKNAVTNSGTINGEVNLGSGKAQLVNSGKITDGVWAMDGNDTVRNSGTIDGMVFLGLGTNVIVNSGTIGGRVLGHIDGDSVTNSGTIGDDIDLDEGADRLSNSGFVNADVFVGSGNDTVTSSRSITGDVSLGDGTNKLTNSGTIDGDVSAGIDADTITNSGLVTGTVDLGGGDDRFTGGRFADQVKDGGGSDTIRLAGGDDRYLATTTGLGSEGADNVDGGAGVDIYDASATTDGVYINLDTVAHNPGPGNVAMAARTAIGGSVASDFKDTITGFENAAGGKGHDVIFGTAAANELEGGDGNDDIVGYGGHDTLIGGGGNDHLNGGVGKDTLTGGTEADVFSFSAIGDSNLLATGRDVIADFEDSVDRIQILFDANTKNGPGTVDHFVFIGADVAFGGVAGQLRAYSIAGGYIVEGDVNGNAKADFSIELRDASHTIVLDSADFIL